MTELKMTHVLLLAVAAFLMYHFIGGCNCNRGDGFNVGGQSNIYDSPLCGCRYNQVDDPTLCNFTNTGSPGSGYTFKSSQCNQYNNDSACSLHKEQKGDFIPLNNPCKWNGMNNNTLYKLLNK